MPDILLFPVGVKKMFISHGLKSCNEVYEAIGIFAFLADKEWEKDEEKAARYVLASANYATIYKTVCNQK